MFPSRPGSPRWQFLLGTHTLCLCVRKCVRKTLQGKHQPFLPPSLPQGHTRFLIIKGHPRGAPWCVWPGLAWRSSKEDFAAGGGGGSPQQARGNPHGTSSSSSSRSAGGRRRARQLPCGEVTASRSLAETLLSRGFGPSGGQQKPAWRGPQGGERLEEAQGTKKSRLVRNKMHV